MVEEKRNVTPSYTNLEHRLLLNYYDSVGYRDDIVAKLGCSQLFKNGSMLVGSKMRNWCHENKMFVFGRFNNLVVFDNLRTTLSVRRAILFLDRLFNVNRFTRLLFVSVSNRMASLADETVEGAWLTHYFSNIQYFPFILKWIPGLLTNSTVLRSLWGYALNKTDADVETLAVIEGLRALNGRLPTVLFFLRINGKRLVESAIAEAVRVGVPTLGVVDSDGSSWGVDYPIYGGSFAVTQVRFYLNLVVSTALRRIYSRGSVEFNIVGNINMPERGVPIIVESDLSIIGRLKSSFHVFNANYLRVGAIFESVLFRLGRVASTPFSFCRKVGSLRLRNIRKITGLRFITAWLRYFIFQFFRFWMFGRFKFISRKKRLFLKIRKNRRSFVLDRVWGTLLWVLKRFDWKLINMKLRVVRERAWVGRRWSGMRVHEYLRVVAKRLRVYLRRYRAYRSLKWIGAVFSRNKLKNNRGGIIRYDMRWRFNLLVQIVAGSGWSVLRLIDRFRFVYDSMLTEFSLVYKPRKFVYGLNWWARDCYLQLHLLEEAQGRREFRLKHFYIVSLLFWGFIIAKFGRFVKRLDEAETIVNHLVVGGLQQSVVGSRYLISQMFRGLYKYGSYRRLNRFLVGGELNKKILRRSVFLKNSEFEVFWRLPIVLLAISAWLVDRKEHDRRLFYFIRRSRFKMLRFAFFLRKNITRRYLRKVNFNSLWELKYTVPIDAKRYIGRRERFVVLPRLYRRELVNLKYPKREVVRQLFDYKYQVRSKSYCRWLRRRTKRRLLRMTVSSVGFKSKSVDNRIHLVDVKSKSINSGIKKSGDGVMAEQERMLIKKLRDAFEKNRR